jgi:long-chain fatty acid transport protein
MRAVLRGAAVFAALLASPALATNGMRMTGFGPVQNSMGGVGVGATLDAASIISNPAGMATLGGRVDFGATYFQPFVEYRATQRTPQGPVAGQTMDSDRRGSPVPSFGLVFPIDEKLTFGVGGYGISGMGVDYETDLFGSTTYTSSSQMRFAPGLAYRVNGLVTVGAVVNAMYATMGYQAATQAELPGGASLVSHDSATAYGIGGTFGVVVTPTAALSLGATYETRSFFQDFEFNTPTGHDSIDFDQPSVVTAGAGFRPFGKLLLATDIQWIRWSETNGQNMPEFTDAASTPVPFRWNLDWDDQLVFKVGAEYAAASWLKVRAGYNYGKTPLNAVRAFENIAFPAVAEHHVTAGLGLDVGKATVNLGAMYAPRVELAGDASDGGIASYETSMSQLAFDMGVAYRF